MRPIRCLLAAVVLVALCATPARAGSIVLAGDSSTTFDILWSKVVSGTELRALGTFKVDVTDDYVNFAVKLTNETDLYNERIHSLGFNTDPNATGITMLQAGTWFNDFGLTQKFPGFQQIDFCSWAVNKCQGGAQQQNMPGADTSDYFRFQLTGNFSNGITLSTFAIQFMGDLGSFQFEGGDRPPTNVPEPGTLLLFGFALCVSPIAARKRT